MKIYENEKKDYIELLVQKAKELTFAKFDFLSIQILLNTLCQAHHKLHKIKKFVKEILKNIHPTGSYKVCTKFFFTV